MNLEKHRLPEDYEREITQLKAELRVERSCTDFYADIESWNLKRPNDSDLDKGMAIRINCIDHSFEGVGLKRLFGGKLARLTQKNRRIEL
jgi:hypothetical protein